jgi:hypothetical protein
MTDNKCEQSGTRVLRYGEPVGTPPAPGADTTYERVTCPGCDQRVLMHVGSGRLAEHAATERVA